MTAARREAQRIPSHLAVLRGIQRIERRRLRTLLRGTRRRRRLDADAHAGRLPLRILFQRRRHDLVARGTDALPHLHRTANLLRLRDGRIVLTWNHCELPPRHEGEGVYGGRDALHIAISDDEGKTWRGFREIYLDHRRNDNPASNGDRGTAYPLGASRTKGGSSSSPVRARAGRNPILVDPDWITATTAETDFRDGLAQWSVYRHTGPAKRWWRARETGCELIETPGRTGTKSLRVRRQDGKEPDTAVWNFRTAGPGQLTARGSCCPRIAGCGDLVERPLLRSLQSARGGTCRLPVRAEAGDGASGVWQDLSLHWDLGEGSCECLLGTGSSRACRS